MGAESHGECANIAGEWAHMPKMIVINSKRIKVGKKNASKGEEQKEKQKAKMPHHQGEIKEETNRMSRGHGR